MNRTSTNMGLAFTRAPFIHHGWVYMDTTTSKPFFVGRAPTILICNKCNSLVGGIILPMHSESNGAVTLKEASTQYTCIHVVNVTISNRIGSSVQTKSTAVEWHMKRPWTSKKKTRVNGTFLSSDFHSHILIYIFICLFLIHLLRLMCLILFFVLLRTLYLSGMWSSVVPRIDNKKTSV